MDLFQWPRWRSISFWLHVVIWGVVLVFYTLLFSRVLPVQFAIGRALANIIPLASLFYLNTYFVNKFLRFRKYVQYLLWLVPVFALFMIIRVRLNLQFPEIEFLLDRIDELRFQRVVALLTNAGMLVVSAFYAFVIIRNENERKHLALINAQNVAQLKFLRAQINPHFLFNTLHNIYSLAIVKSDKTADMVLRLSNLLRYVTYDGQSEKVQLEQEVVHIQEYIHLYQMKSEEPLNIQFSVKGAIKDRTIEPMILIPLVENCFKHCDIDSNPDSFIQLMLEYGDHKLSFKTHNSKNDQDNQKDRVGGVGLENIQRRLELCYPNKYEFSVQNNNDDFQVSLQIEFDDAKN